MTEPALSFVGVWTALIALGVFLYVLLDGFDLGVGMLHGFAHDAADREVIMNSIAPIWDGNETWLVFCGVALLAAFPLAFAIIIPAVYFPILVMLIALVFRGVAFEFRFGDRVRRAFWDRAFQVGSFVAVFAQGVVLGAFIQGFRVEGRRVQRHLRRFSDAVLDIDGLGAAFRLRAARRRVADHQDRGRAAGLGATPRPDMPDRGRHRHRRRQPVDAADGAADRRALVLAAPNPVSVAGADRHSGGCRLGHGGRSPAAVDAAPFIAAILLFLLAYLGVAISLWPMIVPYHFTLWQAASPPSTQAFLLVGALFLIPIILMYSGWSYWVFAERPAGTSAITEASCAGAFRLRQLAAVIVRVRDLLAVNLPIVCAA